MTSDLVTFSIHALDDFRIACIWVIDLAFAAVVTNYEEGRFHIIGFEGIQEIICPNIRAIIEGQGDFARNRAMENTNTVWNIS